MNIGDANFNIEASNEVPHIEKIFSTGFLTDAKLMTEDGKTIDVHRCILARSPVFRAMFLNEMKEKQNGEVRVNDIRHEVLKKMVMFIYSNRVSDLDPIAGELMLAADYYDLPDLRAMCLKSLEDHVTFKNFTFSLYIAERFGVVSLKEAVLNFVIG